MRGRNEELPSHGENKDERHSTGADETIGFAASSRATWPYSRPLAVHLEPFRVFVNLIPVYEVLTDERLEPSR